MQDAFGQQPFVELLDAERLSLQLQVRPTSATRCDAVWCVNMC